MRPALIPLLLAAAVVAGCGSATTTGTTGSATGTTAGPAAGRLTGTTSQGQGVSVTTGPAGVVVDLGFQLTCRDGSTTTSSVDNASRRVPLEAGGMFYVEESGATPASTFPGFGAGEYRWAISGQVQGSTAQGKAAFRVHFKETTCKATGVTWQARR